MYKRKKWKRYIALLCSFALLLSGVSALGIDSNAAGIRMEDLQFDNPENDPESRFLDMAEITGSLDENTIEFLNPEFEMKGINTATNSDVVERTIVTEEVVLDASMEEDGTIFTDSTGTFPVTNATIPEGSSMIVPGTSITATFSKGTLTLKGSGTLTNNPFYGYKESIKAIKVTENVVLGSLACASLDLLKTVTISGNATAIGAGAFAACPALTSVSISSKVKSIGTSAFDSCVALQTISLPSSVTSLGDYVFFGCTSLKNVSIPGVKTIGFAGFAGCTSLTSIVLPSTLRSLGVHTFNYCTALKTVTVNAGITHIEDYAFVGCQALETINFPNTVNSFGDFVFMNCTALKEFTAPETITFGEGVFGNCTGLVNFVMPEKVTSTGNDIFYGCSSLESMQLSPVLTGVADGSFYKCTALKSISFPESVTAIGTTAFYGCESMEDVTFSDTYVDVASYAFSFCNNAKTFEGTLKLKNVGEQAFYATAIPGSIQFSTETVSIDSAAFQNCHSLVEIDFNNAILDVSDSVFFDCPNFVSIKNAPTYKSVGEGAFYQCAAVEVVSFTEDASLIAAGCFYGCTNLKTIDFNNCTADIKHNAFTQCTSLEEVILSPNCKMIEKAAFACCNRISSLDLSCADVSVCEYAFYECTGLNNLTGEEGIKEIGEYAFFCTNIKDADDLETVEFIGEGAFAECDSMVSVTLPDTLKKVEKYAFAQCDKLKTIKGGAEVTFIGEQAFSWCTLLEQANFPKAIEVEKHAFNHCEALDTAVFSDDMELLNIGIFACCYALKEFSIPNNINKIEEAAFYQCNSLVEIEIPEKVSEIQASAFFECETITEAILPDSLEILGDSVFAGCTSLTNVHLPKKLETIPLGSFTYCSNLSTIDMPEKLKEIGFAAFFECKNLNSLDLAPTLLSIDDYAFGECHQLSNVEISECLTSLGEYAFYNCKTLTKVSLPIQIANVPNYAFHGCEKLEEVQCRGKLIGIGVGAFYNCSLLRDIFFYGGVPAYIGDGAFVENGANIVIHSINLDDNFTTPKWTGPNGTTYTAIEIKPSITGTFSNGLKWEFYENSGDLVITGNGRMEDYSSIYDVPWYDYVNQIHTVHIKEGVTSIGDRAFAEHPMLRSVYMEDSVTSCGVYAFSKCENLVYADLSDYMKSLGDYAFYNCTNMSNLTLPVSLQTVGDYAFFGCVSVTGIGIPDSVKKLGEGVFYNCTGLRNIVLSSAITKVEDHTFKGCKELERVLLGINTSVIGKFAFADCEKLEYVGVLNESLEIQNYAFNGCTSLEALHMVSGMPSSIGYKAFHRAPDTFKIKYSMDGEWAETYEATDGTRLNCEKLEKTAGGSCGEELSWKYFEQAALLHISGNGDMSDFTENDTPWKDYQNKIRYVVMEEEVETVGANAFYQQTGLEKVMFSKNLLEIGEGAFADCEKLQYVDFPDSLTSLGKNSFYCCNSLAGAHIPENIKEIPAYAFALCEQLQILEIESGVEKISYAAFYACDSLKTALLPETVAEVEAWAFARCPKLHKIEANNVSSLGIYAFYGDELLEEIPLCEKLEEISDYSFAGTGVKKLILHDSVQSIGEGAFWGCEQLETVNLGDVEIIESQAFMGSGLKTIVIPDDTHTVADYAFANCENLKDIQVENNSKYYSSESGVLYDLKKETLIQYPTGKTSATFTVPDGVVSIQNGAFYEAAFTLAVLPEEMDELGAGSFANSSVREVKFEGDSPSEIGVNAFYGTSAELKFVVSSEKDGWNDSQWQGPDGNDYQVEYEEKRPYILTLGESIQNEEDGTVSYKVYLKNNTEQTKTVSLWVAIYQKDEMLASRKVSTELIHKMEYETDILLSGGVKYPGEELQIKVFLLEDETQEPLTPAQAAIYAYELLEETELQLDVGEMKIRNTSETFSTTSIEAVMSEINDEATEKTMAVNMEFTAAEFNELLDCSANNSIAGVNFDVHYEYQETQSENRYSTNLNISEYDQVFGFVPSDVTVDHDGYMQWPDDIPGLPMEYDEFSMLTTDRIALNLETAEFSKLHIRSEADVTNEIIFAKEDKNLFTLRAVGFATGSDDRMSEWRKDGSFVFNVPYEGSNLLVKLYAQAMADELAQNSILNEQNNGISQYELSLEVKDASNTTQTLCKIKLVTDETKVTDISVLELAEAKTTEIDKSYNPLKYDESTEPLVEMELSVADIKPAKGSNGKVTVKLEGTRMEAGAEVFLKNGETEIPAQNMYYFAHDKLYVTFDLTKVANGSYQVILKQKDQIVTGPEFTVDSSLPKGKLTAKINVDKSAKIGKENKGSITYTNTGYTDVYAPVVLIDCGKIQFKGEEHDKFMTQDSVFVSNTEGLSGIIANGETAAYNFTYKLTNKQFVMKLYNYLEIKENVTDKIVLNEKSTGTDVLNYNMFEIMGWKACDYAKSIAEMACVQSSLGNKELNISKLREAFIPAATGSLTGEVLSSSTDLVSRELLLQRYYYGDTFSQNTEGLWGSGWFSNYDITAELTKEKDESKNYITIREASGMAVYEMEDGVYTESIYGKSTAEIIDEKIAVTYEDGTVYRFNSDGKLGSITDVYGNTIRLTYNEDQKPVKIETTTGDSLIFDYKEGKLSTVTSSATEDVVEYHYTENVLVDVMGAYDKVSYQYQTNILANGRPLLSKISSETGVTQTLEYDSLGRVISVSNGEGVVSYEYFNGCALKTTNAVGEEYTTYHNSAGKTVRVLDAAGNTVNNEYSEMLMNTGRSVGLFETATYSYDDKYNLSKMTDGDGNSISYDYDSRSNMTKITDRAGVVTEYQRNELGNVQRLLYADGKYESVEYDSKGNIISATKRDGTTTEFTYNEYSQLITVAYETGETISYEYDKRGNITKIDEGGQITSLQYDGKGSLAKVIYPDQKMVTYTYDDYGRLIKTKSEYDGTSATENYEYDNMNRLKNVNVGTNIMVSYEYYEDGSLKRQTNLNGTYTVYKYDKGALKELRNCLQDDTVVSSFTYTYNDMGKIETIKDESGTWNYGYDKQGQVTKVTAPDGTVTVYSYDLSGNRTNVVTETNMINYNSNELNQYTSVGSTKLSYDVNGNLISRKDESGQTTYEYDYAERLVKVTESDGTVTSYSYDAFGNRASVTVGEDITEYLYTPTGGGHPMVSYRNGIMENVYIQGNGIASTLRVDLQDKETSDIPVYYFMYNHLGSTTEIIDHEGNIVNHYDYDAEGNVTSKVEGTDNNLTYVGKYGIMDDGNGLYYARARYISSDTRSFISVDPIGQSGDLNVYRYAGNDWVNYVDITGEAAVIALAVPYGVGMAAGAGTVLAGVGTAMASAGTILASPVVLTTVAVVIGAGIIYSINGVGGGGFNGNFNGNGSGGNGSGGNGSGGNGNGWQQVAKIMTAKELIENSPSIFNAAKSLTGPAVDMFVSQTGKISTLFGLTFMILMDNKAKASEEGVPTGGASGVANVNSSDFARSLYEDSIKEDFAMGTLETTSETQIYQENYGNSYHDMSDEMQQVIKNGINVNVINIIQNTSFWGTFIGLIGKVGDFIANLWNSFIGWFS